MKERECSGKLLLVVLLGASMLARWPLRGALLVRDEGEYAYLGQEILRGALPYADVYNQKTPFTFYLMAAIEKLAGRDLAALRMATAGYGLLTTVVLYALGRRLLGPAAGLWTALAYAVMTFDQCAAQYPASAEFFMLLWMALAAYLYYLGRGTGSPGQLVLAGIAAGLAYQTKQTGAVMLCFLLADPLWTWWTERDRPAGTWRRVLATQGLVLAGFALVLAATLGYFAARGGLRAYLECTWTNNWQYVGRRHHDGVRHLLTLAWRMATEMAGIDIGLWIMGALSLLAWARRGLRSRLRGSGLWILLCGTAAAALLAGAPYRHYGEPMIVPLSLGAGAGCSWLWTAAGGASAWPRRAVLALLLTAPWVGPAVHDAAYVRQDVRERALSPLLPFHSAQRAAAYLSAHTSPEEPVLVVGSEPEIYYYAHRRAATRLVFTYPLTGPYAAAPRLQEEFYSDFQKLPRYVVVLLVPQSIGEFPERVGPFMHPLVAVLRRHYQQEAVFSEGGRQAMAIFRRNP